MTQIASTPRFTAKPALTRFVLFALFAIVASASITYGQPNGFMEDFAGPNLDAAWIQNGDLNGHPTIIAGTYDITDAHGQPGTAISRSIGGTAGSFVHEIDLVLDPHLSGGTQSDFKLQSIGSDGILGIVYNSFGHLRVDHVDYATGSSDHIIGGHPDNIAIDGYADGGALNLKVVYDDGTDTIDVTYSVDGAAPVSVYSGTGIDGRFGDVVTGSVQVSLFKFGDNSTNQTVASIDNWSLGPGIVSGLACDSDGDVDCEQDDINAMYAAFGGGGQFDYDGSGEVDDDDISLWLANASSSTNLYNTGNKTFVTGDVNLDGSVDSADLGLALNNFTSNTALNWGDGNLDGDGVVGSADLGLLLNRFDFTSAAAQSVPEPSGLALLLLSLVGLIRLGRSRN